jgi:hypothetical protein
MHTRSQLRRMMAIYRPPVKKEITGRNLNKSDAPTGNVRAS